MATTTPEYTIVEPLYTTVVNGKVLWVLVPMPTAIEPDEAAVKAADKATAGMYVMSIEEARAFGFNR